MAVIWHFRRCPPLGTLAFGRVPSGAKMNGGILRNATTSPWRTAQAAVLLAGFYLLGFAIVAALVALDVFGVWMLAVDGPGFQLLVLTVPTTIFALFIVARGVTVSTRFNDLHVPGVAVTPEQEPELWARVRRLAAAMDAHGPKEIFIGYEPDAAVWEYGPLFGLLPGKRYMLIGAPLLLALTPAQLDAALGHELGHYANSDTRLGPLVNRGRIGLLTALRISDRSLAVGAKPAARKRRRFEPRGWWYIALTLQWYANLYFTLTDATSRAQEYAADRAGARVAGRDAMVSALAELPVIAAAYRFYLKHYAYFGVPYGLLPEPAEVIGGFRSLIEDPQRQAEFQDRRGTASGRVSRFDSHPPLPDRLAALHRLPVGTPLVPSCADGPAVELLRDRRHVLAQVGEKMLGSSAAGKTRLDWPELVDAVAFRSADEIAAPLVRAVTTVAAVLPQGPRALLDAVDAGLLPTIVARLDPADRSDRALADRLRAWVLVTLAERGQVHWELSWSRPAVLQAPPRAAALDAAVAALLAGPGHNTAPLRAILDGDGSDLE